MLYKLSTNPVNLNEVSRLTGEDINSLTQKVIASQGIMKLLTSFTGYNQNILYSFLEGLDNEQMGEALDSNPKILENNIGMTEWTMENRPSVYITKVFEKTIEEV